MSAQQVRRDVAGEGGFSLIELMVVMAIAGILLMIGSFGFVNWQRTAQQQGSAKELVSQLRNASERAISEGRTYCVDIDSTNRSYTLWRYACDSTAGSQVAGPYTTQSPNVTFAPALLNPSPAPLCPASNSCLYFYPRGTAIPATVNVNSSARSKVYTVTVEGLTARVYM